MSGAVVVTPAAGAAWATAWEQFEGIRKGMISLSLTNYDAAAVPQIASGSWIEAIGSIYKWTGDDAIVGAPTNDVINYITMVPSGVGASAILTPTWSAVAPTWSDAYQGWFSGTTRYAGGCYYDGANYPLKWVYTNRHAGPKVDHFTFILNQGHASGANFNVTGASVIFGNITDILVSQIFLPSHAIIDGIYMWGACGGADAATVYFYRHEIQSSANTTIGQFSVDAGSGGDGSDTTITTPVVDNENYYYILSVDPTARTAGPTVYGCQIEYTEIVRC